MSVIHTIIFKLRATPEEYLKHIDRAEAAENRARAIEKFATNQAQILKETLSVLKRTFEKLDALEKKESSMQAVANVVHNSNLRVTADMVEGAIKSEHSVRVPGTTRTLVTLILTNGFTVTGQSACADPAMFNEELGVKYAREDAIEKLYEFEAYRLMSEFNRDKV